MDFGLHFRHEGADRAFASYKEGICITVSDVSVRAGTKPLWRERTFREFTNLFLHVRHRIPLRWLLRLLLRSIAAIGLLWVVDGIALRIGELTHLLLLLLPQRVLVLRILLLVLEQQPARKLLVQLGLLGLFLKEVCGRRVVGSVSRVGWRVMT